MPDLEAFTTDLDEFVKDRLASNGSACCFHVQVARSCMRRRWWHIFEDLAAGEDWLSCLNNCFEGLTRWKEGRAAFDISKSVLNPLPGLPARVDRLPATELSQQLP